MRTREATAVIQAAGATQWQPNLLRLSISRTIIELRQFFRDTRSAVFTFAFPVMLLVLFGGIISYTIKGPSGQLVNFRQYFISGMIAAGIISTTVVKQGSGYQTASSEAPTAGTRLLVGFKSDATLNEITAFLDTNHGSIVSGPSAGMFTVKFGDKTLAAADAEQLIAKVKADKIVTFAAATQ